MTINDWDADLAVLFGPLDELLDGQPASDRYGVTEWEEVAGEPLAVALSQEEPDVVADVVDDDQWSLVDPVSPSGDQLFSRADDHCAEEMAMHVERV